MIDAGDSIVLERDVDAFLIPSGTPVKLHTDETVVITQALGGSYTVLVAGNLMRIHARDADALGLTPSSAAQEKRLIPGLIVTEEMVWEQLRTCYDPEIPVNIADLGLIYDMDIIPLENSAYHVKIEMTLTAVGCGMGPILVQDVYDAVLRINNVVKADVELVFDPPWDQSMMTDSAQLQLGLL